MGVLFGSFGGIFLVFGIFIYWISAFISLFMNKSIYGTEYFIWLIMMVILPFLTPAVYYVLRTYDSLPIRQQQKKK
ncbi:hypothetical protein [Myroides injenensis]|uniref:hypothetical protein n=1 Tax=Myroides injenensis TaxID=1183151 RepID=UPI00028850D2|nr:hypothetical protein [Myroides injenensis]